MLTLTYLDDLKLILFLRKFDAHIYHLLKAF